MISSFQFCLIKQYNVTKNNTNNYMHIEEIMQMCMKLFGIGLIAMEVK